MSATNELLEQWRVEGKLDTSGVPKDELAMTLVLLYLRGDTHDKKQSFCPKLQQKKAADVSFQRAVIAELYLNSNDLKMTPAVVETIYEWTLTESPLRKFAVRCWLARWCKNRDECCTMPAEFRAELAAAEQERGCKPGWVISYVLSFLDRKELIGMVLDADAMVLQLKDQSYPIATLEQNLVVGGMCPHWVPW